jgi:hypothetical protein
MAVGENKNPVKMTLTIPNNQGFRAWEYPSYMEKRRMAAPMQEATLGRRLCVVPK